MSEKFFLNAEDTLTVLSDFNRMEVTGATAEELRKLYEALREEMHKIREQTGDSAFENGHYRRAAQLLDEITRQDTFTPFLTSVAYADIE